MRLLGTLGCCCIALAACADPSSGNDATTTEEARVVRVERGVDRASVLSVHEARILHADHGVRWTGVYIGGACSGGSGWTKSAVTHIANATGWQFMPIWVGQQSPPICGAHSLSYTRGHADGVATAHRMREMGWGPNKDIPVALDVEAGTYFYSPNASTRYVRGWVRAVRAAGFRPYVYGSPYGLNHFHDAGVRIDAAWAASYFYRGFKAVAPGALDQMGNRYRHHNRAWQYAGNFYVSGVGYVDANTSSLLLAPKPGGTNRAKTAARTVPASCGTLEAGEGLARGETVASCDGNVSLAMTDSGELVLTVGGKATWSSGTDGIGETAVLDDNGELIVYDAGGEPVFASDTAGFPDAHVDLSSGLAVVDDAGTALWSARDGLLVEQDPSDGDQLQDDSEPLP
jgi:hypothetical protein